tara:strand:+ start:300 stop:512 length:213 start_codon:yes stop_codon:yes gene_type:complete
MSETSFTKTVIDCFKKKQVLSLKELYSMLDKQISEAESPGKAKHRIRAIIFALHKRNQLEHVDKGTWKMV